MAREIELKLEIPPSAVPRVARLEWLRKLASGPARTEKLVTVYFDTPKLKLRRHGLAIRIRHAGKRRLQTIKTAHGGSAFSRDEWEHEISGDEPDLALAKGTALEPLATKKLRGKLKPIFETAIVRTILPIHSDGADLELAVDHGHIRAHGGRVREAVSEIEIEVKRGDPVQLARIASRLSRSLPVAYGPRSKAERGYALSADEAGNAVMASEMSLEPRLSTGDAFRVIGLSCLDHVVSNTRAVREGDAEGVHQMRVGLRRLRAAISIFNELVQGPEPEAIKVELRWLTEQLTPARDLEVLIEERVRPLRGSAPIAAEAEVLEQELEARRNAGLEQARAAVESKRYRSIGLDTALWLADGTWSRSDDALAAALRERPAVEFAAEALARRSKRISKRARGIEELDALGRHELRIAVKKLRYACEFFSGLFPGRKREARRTRFYKTLKVLQDSLGTLNDIEVHKGLARRIARPRKQTRVQACEALAMGFIAGQEQKQVASCIAAIGEAARSLSELPGFWR